MRDRRVPNRIATALMVMILTVAFTPTALGSDAPIVSFATHAATDEMALATTIVIESRAATALRMKVDVVGSDRSAVVVSPARVTESLELAPGDREIVRLERAIGAGAETALVARLLVEPVDDAFPLGFAERVLLPPGEPARPAIPSWTGTVQGRPGSVSELTLPLLNSGPCRSVFFPGGHLGTLAAERHAIAIDGACEDTVDGTQARLRVPGGADGHVFAGTVDLSPGIEGGEITLSVLRRAPPSAFWIPLVIGAIVAYVVARATALRARVERIRIEVEHLSIEADVADAAHDTRRSESKTPKRADPAAKGGEEQALAPLSAPEGDAAERRGWNIACIVEQHRRKLARRCDAQTRRWAIPTKDDNQLTTLERDVAAALTTAASWPPLREALSRYDALVAASDGLDLLVKLDIVKARAAEELGADATLDEFERIPRKRDRLAEVVEIVRLWPAETVRALELKVTTQKYRSAVPAWGAFEFAARRARDLEGVRFALTQLDQVVGFVTAVDAAQGGPITLTALEGDDAARLAIEDPIRDERDERLWKARGRYGWLLFVGAVNVAVAIGIALYAAAELLYVEKPFGGAWSYLAAAAWGLGGGLLASSIRTALSGAERIGDDRDRLLGLIRRARAE